MKHEFDTLDEARVLALAEAERARVLAAFGARVGKALRALARALDAPAQPRNVVSIDAYEAERIAQAARAAALRRFGRWLGARLRHGVANFRARRMQARTERAVAHLDTHMLADIGYVADDAARRDAKANDNGRLRAA